MQPLVEKYRPKKLTDFAGLSGPRAVLTRFASEPYASAWLLMGGAGTGKTTMAFALAEEIGAEVHHIPSRNCDLETVEKVCASCFYHPWAGDWHAVIVDEADQMSRAAQLAFLSKLDSTAPPPAPASARRFRSPVSSSLPCSPPCQNLHTMCQKPHPPKLAAM